MKNHNKKTRNVIILSLAIVITISVILPFVNAKVLDFEIIPSLAQNQESHDNFTFGELVSFEWDTAYIGASPPLCENGKPYKAPIGLLDWFWHWRFDFFGGGSGELFVFFIRNNRIVRCGKLGHSLDYTCYNSWISPETVFEFLPKESLFFFRLAS
jgi:hypothetical protein